MNKLVTISAILGISFPIVACGETEEAKFEKAAVKELVSELKDPDSAKISDAKVLKCPSDTARAKKYKDNRSFLFQAQLNAKNSYGAYTGKKPWQCIALRTTDDIYCEEDHDIKLSSFCKDDDVELTIAGLEGKAEGKAMVDSILKQNR